MRFFIYITQKLLQAFVTILIAIVVAFFIFRLLPGDPTLSMLDPRLDPVARQKILEEFGLDKPLWEQFILYVKNLFKGDLGYSFRFVGERVIDVITGPRLFNTLVLMSSGIALSAVIGTLLGLFIGWRSGSLLDKILTNVLYMIFSAPVFWVALLIQFYLGYRLRWIPISGTSSYIGSEVDIFTYSIDYLKHMIGPLLTLAIFFIPSYYIYIRNIVSQLKLEDFVTTLKALGLREKRILLGHIFRHVAIHTLTITTNQSPLLVGGAVFTETVFGWNGIGRLTYESILATDYPVLQGVFLLTITVVVIANLLADALYYFIDPRIKRSR